MNARFFATISMALAFAVACGDDSSDGGGGAGGTGGSYAGTGGDSYAPPTPCGAVTCQPGQRCISDTCVETCEDDSGCASGSCCAGLCADVSSDRAHCGGCDAACDDTEDCTDGACVALVCDPPADDCGPAGCDQAPTPDAMNSLACAETQCAMPGLGGTLCCTAVGAGVEDDALELTGRDAQLCGLDIGAFDPALAGVCLQYGQPGEVDADCPELDGRPGCCTEEGFCGSMESQLGLGCTYPAFGKGASCGRAGLRCNGITCAAPQLGGAPCCTAEGAGIDGDPYLLTGRAAKLCGLDIGAFVPDLAGVCLQVGQPGELDDTCPEVEGRPGCCSEEGHCGSMESDLGLGCTYPDAGKGGECGSVLDAVDDAPDPEANGCASGESCSYGVDGNTCRCGAAAACGAGQRCVDGACMCGDSTACQGVQVCCGSGCVDTATDADNCGACGAACPESATCEAGACACPDGQLACDGACVDPAADALHCGGCGLACPDGSACDAGQCACDDADAFACAGGCADLTQTDTACGVCNNVCGEFVSCLGDPSVGYDCRCPNFNQEVCADGCRDLQTDEANCGGCGNVCDGIASVCREGACECPVEGEIACGDVCVDPHSDADNCGGCDVACDGAGTTRQCIDGLCGCGDTDQFYCDLDDNGGPQDFACIDGGVANCGACGNQCLGFSSCVADACLCDDDAQLHCFGIGCADLSADIDNCGECGLACEGASDCVDSLCECPAGGDVYCDGECIDGETDRDNCGACGNVCERHLVCDAGDCECPNSGDISCDGVCADLSEDVDNCGACGNVCDQGDTCCNGSCVDTDTDRRNCTGCGRSCDSDMVCDPGLNPSEGPCCDPQGDASDCEEYD